MDPGQQAGQVGGQVTGAGQQVGRGAQQATESGPVRLLGRVGLVCYGVVHLLIAFLALQVVTGDGGEELSKSGALQTVAAQPGGTLLLWTITVGMAALAIWQVAEAVWGHRYVPRRRRALKRVASAGEAAVAGLLAFSAGRLAAGDPKSSGESAELTARVLEWPGGQVLVGVAGVVIVAVAVWLVRHGLIKRFVEDMDLSGADARARRTAIRVGQVGWAALGVAYGVVGVLVVVAAVTHDPEKAAGLDAGLKTLAAQPYGPVLLGVVAAGLACFGVFCLFDARYRRG